MVSGIGAVFTPLSPSPTGRGGASGKPSNAGGASNKGDATSAPRRRPESGTQNAGQSQQQGTAPNDAIDERTGRATKLQVFRADQVPLKSLQALQTYGEVASQDRSSGVELAGLSIHV